jgi:hypothetical protein
MNLRFGRNVFGQMLFLDNLTIMGEILELNDANSHEKMFVNFYLTACKLIH